MHSMGTLGLFIMDYEKAKASIAKELIEEATDNGSLTDGEALYLIQYYNLDN